jgi:hypothetical protein
MAPVTRRREREDYRVAPMLTIVTADTTAGKFMGMRSKQRLAWASRNPGLLHS